MQSINRLESEVRSYVRTWPTTFASSQGHEMFDEDGRRYLDFFAGAGVLNYGHNNPVIRDALLDHLRSGAVVHSLDQATTTRSTFLETLDEIILQPRGMSYKVQFPGPTGTNAVEAALKLARKVTGRERVIGFTNAFHGMTLGSLSVSGNGGKRDGAGISLTGATSLPFDGYLGSDVDTAALLAAMLDDSGSGLAIPAAVIVETVQAEGGINVATADWLRRIQGVCREHGILLIVDDIQVGCGRTGPFFSFEGMGIEPDILVLSKSLSGYGLPFALTLMRPELDVWEPGEHNGTFRGFTPAMATAIAAMQTYWRDDRLSDEVTRKAMRVEDSLESFVDTFPELALERRGRGLIQGLVCRPGVADKVSRAAFERGLLIETAGADGEVVKLLPPLTITDDGLAEGLQILETALAETAGRAVPEAVATMGGRR